jgi:hypothetical protein
VDDEMEVIHADSSAKVAMTDTPLLEDQDGIACLSSHDLFDFQFISVTKDGVDG